jgi:hypothetical protein
MIYSTIWICCWDSRALFIFLAHSFFVIWAQYQRRVCYCVSNSIEKCLNVQYAMWISMISFVIIIRVGVDHLPLGVFIKCHFLWMNFVISWIMFARWFSHYSHIADFVDSLVEMIIPAQQIWTAQLQETFEWRSIRYLILCKIWSPKEFDGNVTQTLIFRWRQIGQIGPVYYICSNGIQNCLKRHHSNVFTRAPSM